MGVKNYRKHRRSKSRSAARSSKRAPKSFPTLVLALFWHSIFYVILPKRLSENQTHKGWGTKMVDEYLLFLRYVIYIYIYILNYIILYFKAGSHRGPGGVGDQWRHLPGTRENVPAGLWWRTWAHISRSWWSPWSHNIYIFIYLFIYIYIYIIYICNYSRCMLGDWVPDGSLKRSTLV